MVAQGKRAMYILSKSYSLNLPIDITCELFDSLVNPVLLYGCEVWGFENIDNIESLHVKFCKTILKFAKVQAELYGLVIAWETKNEKTG